MAKVVIIPAYDPDERLKQLVLENWEQDNLVLVVDDGSDPSCSSLFEELEEKSIVLHHKKNLGKGVAIKTALEYIQHELWHCSVIGIMDADGQHTVTDMKHLMEESEQHPDALVIGARTVDKKMPWKSRMGNRITRSIFRIVSGVSVCDTQTGLRSFTPKLLHTMLEIPGDRYEYEMNVLLTCAKKKIEIREVPIQTIYHDQQNSCSHFRKVRDSIRIYKDILKFTLFSMSSFVLDYTLFAILTLLLPKTAWAISTSNIGARILSGFYNYQMNCHFVFHKRASVQTGAEYLVLAIGILILNNLILNGFVFGLQIPVYPAKILTECTLFVISWLVQNKLIFLKKSTGLVPIRQTDSRHSGETLLLGEGRE